MTTLQLARLIAVAARACDTVDGAAVSVLNVLHATSSWFCRVSEDDDGLTVETRYEDSAQSAPRTKPRDARQPSLFVE